MLRSSMGSGGFYSRRIMPGEIDRIDDPRGGHIIRYAAPDGGRWAYECVIFRSRTSCEGSCKAFYPQICRQNQNVWTAWLPEYIATDSEFITYEEMIERFKTEIDGFMRETKNMWIPQEVREELAITKNEFKDYIVRYEYSWAYHKEVVVMGIRKDGYTYLLARWGRTLISFGEIQKAVEKSEYRMKSTRKFFHYGEIILYFLGTCIGIVGLSFSNKLPFIGIMLLSFFSAYISKLLSEKVSPQILLERYRRDMYKNARPPE